MDKLPFTSFDFWGYLACGFLLLCAVDLAAGYGLIARGDWTVVQGILAISVAYVVGHAIASISSLTLERMLVGRLLGRPSLTLFGAGRVPRWLRRLMGFYFGELPTATQVAILAKSRLSGVAAPGEALFWLAFASARKNDRTMARLSDFLNQYSFCRNVAMVCLIDATLLQWAYLQPSGTAQQLLWARASLLMSVVLLTRYLKFLRHYSLELFTSFAYDKDN